MKTINKKLTTPLWLAPILLGLILAAALPSYADTALSNNQGKDKDVNYSHSLGTFSYNSENAATAAIENPWTLAFGLAAGVGPKYPGSKAQNTAIGLSYSATYKRRLFLNSGQGLGVYFVNTPDFIAGAGINYNLGGAATFRADQYPGLKNVPNPAMGTLFANYTVLSRINLGVQANKAINAMNGGGFYLVNAVTALPISERVLVNFGVSAQYDDGSFMQTYFGVTGPESSASGVSAYNVTSGWDNITYGISPMYKINKHWMLLASVAEQTYVGQVAKSPLIQQSNNFVAAVGVIFNVF
jgi:outer membrane protein